MREDSRATGYNKDGSSSSLDLPDRTRGLYHNESSDLIDEESRSSLFDEPELYAPEFTFAWFDLSCVYRGSHAFRNMSGSVSSGRVTLMCGSSGSGKTSLLSVLGGRFGPHVSSYAKVTGEMRLNNSRLTAGSGTHTKIIHVAARADRSAYFPNLKLREHLEFHYDLNRDRRKTTGANRLLGDECLASRDQHVGSPAQRALSRGSAVFDSRAPMMPSGGNSNVNMVAGKPEDSSAGGLAGTAAAAAAGRGRTIQPGPQIRSVRKAVISAILEMTRLTDFASEYISTLPSAVLVRLTVALALIYQPKVICVDDPFSRLDFHETVDFFRMLKRVCRSCGVAVLVTIDKASSSLAPLLEDIIVISRGATVYAGEFSQLESYVGQLGYAKPSSNYGVLDYLMTLLHSASHAEHFRIEQAWCWLSGNMALANQAPTARDERRPEKRGEYPDTKRDISARKDNADTSRQNTPGLGADRIGLPIATGERASTSTSPAPASAIAGDHLGVTSPNNFNSRQPFSGGTFKRKAKFVGHYLKVFAYQLLWEAHKIKVLTVRELTCNNFRSPRKIVTRTLSTVVVATLVGLLFLKAGVADMYGTDSSSLAAVRRYFTSVAVTMVVAMFAQIDIASTAIPSIHAVTVAESSARLYSPESYLISQVLSEIPVTLITAIVYIITLYWMIGFHAVFSELVIAVALLLFATSSAVWLLSAVSRTAENATQLTALVFVPQIIFSGLVTDVSSLNPYISWMQYLCYLKYFISIAAINEQNGLAVYVPGLVGLSSSQQQQIVINYQTTIVANDIYAEKWSTYTLTLLVYITTMRVVSALLFRAKLKWQVVRPW